MCHIYEYLALLQEKNPFLLALLTLFFVNTQLQTPVGM